MTSFLRRHIGSSNRPATTALALSLILALTNSPLAAASSDFQMLVPGFTVEELPIKLTSLNNIEYTGDGRLYAAGYDGRFHLLRDRDGDGLEEQVDTFSPATSPNYPLGVAVKDGDLYAVLTDEIIRWRDTDGDGVPDRRETVARGFDDPSLVSAPYLHHRRVDSSMALAIAPDGSILTTMGNAGFNNAYWHDKAGPPHYSTDKRRGCLLRINSSGVVEQLHSGLRYIMSLQFNQHGDLFATDQEGATWVPNGNPFDELLHLPLDQSRHYGFPPRHPRWLPAVVDEPSVFDYAPQHQSTCGFRFNGPSPGRGRFGPDWWGHDAFVTGESRGNLYRTNLARTAAGYVAQNQLIARLKLLPVDCAISPRGDLLVCCHSGQPDWGNGPKGAGHVFRIRYTGKPAPQPVLTWPASETETVLAFDGILDRETWKNLAPHSRIVSGKYVSAADHLESLRPGYTVVERQLGQRTTPVAVKSVKLGSDLRTLRIESSPRSQSVQHALSLTVGNGVGTVDVAHDLSGVEASWKGSSGGSWHGWLPHVDLIASREFTRASTQHDSLWSNTTRPGRLKFTGKLDLWEMLIPATQPISKLDYTPDPEQVTVTFRSSSSLTLKASGARVEKISPQESRLLVSSAKSSQWPSFILEVSTPLTRLDVAWSTDRDPRPRAMPLRRFLTSFATPAPRDLLRRETPQIAGGNWENGRTLFREKAACATCHTIRGEGVRVGPDLSNLVHRDYASVLKDINEPSATINPDAVGYVVTQKDGRELTGTRIAETPDTLEIAQPGGTVARLPKSSIATTKPMDVSLMPSGLEKGLTPAELRDLMTFLLNEVP